MKFIPLSGFAINEEGQVRTVPNYVLLRDKIKEDHDHYDAVTTTPNKIFATVSQPRLAQLPSSISHASVSQTSMSQVQQPS